MRRLFTALALLIAPAVMAQPVTGLSGWSIVLDPGHSLTQNQGAFGYSEAEKTLATGLELRRLLLETTDIDTVYITRTTPGVPCPPPQTGLCEITLSERVTYANQTGAAHYHSIHSNAAAPAARSLFVLWAQNPDGSEAVPSGGRAVAREMADLLSRGMRVPMSGPDGTYGECDFYGVSSCRSPSATGPDGLGKGGSRNYVQSYTAMASALSEAGFHTNPEQNQRNMNAEWKRMEARAMYWSFLRYHNATRPPVSIVMGIVRDLESNLPVNGATVEIAGDTYTTDTYASVFNRFSNDPDLLRNGFYYLEDVPAGQQQVTVNVEGFAPFTTTVTPVDTFFTFVDIDLVSTALPTVIASSPDSTNQENFRIIDPIVLTFSRPMDQVSVENGFSISPQVNGSFAWTQGDRRLTFAPDSLVPFTDYTITIAASAQSPFGYALDGNGDGTAGDTYSLSFTTGAPDVVAPRIVAAFPSPNGRGIDRQPVISVTFSELLDSASVSPSLFVLEPNTGGPAIPGTFQSADVGDQTVAAFAPASVLEANTFYRFRIQSGLKDLAGNEIANPLSITFQTREALDEITPIESFEGDFTTYWWQPLQSGSTNTVVADSTTLAVEESVVSPLGGAQAMSLSYGWLTAETSSFLIREYLNAGAPRDVTFDDTYRVQALVFGDGSGTLFRFALDDLPSGHEVSPWHKVDWKGWRLVEWDLANEAPGTWIGDGTLNGDLRFDSFQLSYDGGAAYGTLYFDDLRLAKAMTTAAEQDEVLPDAVTLDTNVPNPFSERTTFVFSIPSTMRVSLRIYDTLGREVAVLVDGETVASGTHRVDWEASGLSSGTYLVRLDAAGKVQTRPVTLLR